MFISFTRLSYLLCVRSARYGERLDILFEILEIEIRRLEIGSPTKEDSKATISSSVHSILSFLSFLFSRRLVYYSQFAPSRANRKPAGVSDPCTGGGWREVFFICLFGGEDRIIPLRAPQLRIASPCMVGFFTILSERGKVVVPASRAVPL